MKRIRVWDLPVRLFHWVLVVLIAAAWATQEYDHMDWHVWCGYAILTLLLFRLVWGVIGSDTARFTRFLKSPFAAFRHLAHIGRREADHQIGHNAAGGWMVMAMLALVGLQAVTGLFSNDDGSTEGPLMHFISKDQSDWLSHIHAVNFKLIEAAILLHIVAILTYAVLKRQDLVRPMITGRKAMPDGTRPPRMVSPVWAVVTLVVATGVVALVVRS